MIGWIYAWGWHTGTGVREYRGSTNNLSKRKSQHWKSLERGTHHSWKANKLVADYGLPTYFTVLEIVEGDEGLLLDREQFYLDELFAGYGEESVNVARTARGGGSPEQKSANARKVAKSKGKFTGSSVYKGVTLDTSKKTKARPNGTWRATATVDGEFTDLGRVRLPPELRGWEEVCAAAAHDLYVASYRGPESTDETDFYNFGAEFAHAWLELAEAGVVH